MSGFIGAAQPRTAQGDEDLRLNRMDFQPERYFAGVWSVAQASYQTPWWPGGANFVGDGGVDVSAFGSVQWGPPDQASSAASMYGFYGITRDQYGTAVGGMTVLLLLQSTGALVASTVSDSTGRYQLPTPYYPDNHVLVIYKSGSPDTAGAWHNAVGS